jgi:hypothetical protein
MDGDDVDVWTGSAFPRVVIRRVVLHHGVLHTYRCKDVDQKAMMTILSKDRGLEYGEPNRRLMSESHLY